VINNANVTEMIGHSWLNNKLQSVYKDTERKIGEVRGYYDNGLLRFQYPLKDNSFHGIGRTWHKDGSIECQEEYVNGLRTGVKRQWYQSGKMQTEKHYKRGLLHGPSKEWYENGNFKEYRTYENGRTEGDLREWRSNGRLEYHGKYSNGLKHGYQKQWDENGKLITEEVYTRGIRVPRDIHRLIISERLNAKIILGIQNAAVRRVCLDEFGYARFLSQVKHEIIEKYGDYELIKIDWTKREEPIYLVKVKCHSTGAYYTLRVPPHMKTIKQAIAWTFYMDKDQYSPIKEA
jgi:antitoxin component YwqK of YwqJK toxin-antitoxin module